jgi:2,7-dihydroxy-5-methyl-1-naphthoate 7-O-methyltransferase
MVDLEPMLDLATPWCLHVAVTLCIPERIAAGHAGITDLAAAAGCDADALHAVLGHLVSKGVFAEESPGRFACNQAAEQLASVPFLDLNGIGGRMAHTWGTLLDYVRTGQPAYQQVFGRPFWEDLAAHPRIGAEFDALMGPAGAAPSSPGRPAWTSSPPAPSHPAVSSSSAGHVTHRPSLKHKGFSFRRNTRGKDASHPVVTV